MSADSVELRPASSNFVPTPRQDRLGGEASANDDEASSRLEARTHMTSGNRARSKPVGGESLYGWYPPATEPTKIVPRKPLLNSYERELLFKFWRSRYAQGAQRQRIQEASNAARRVRPNAAVQTRQPVRVFSLPGEYKPIEVPITQRADPQDFSITVTGQKVNLFQPFRHLRVDSAPARTNDAPCESTSEESHKSDTSSRSSVRRNRPQTAPPGSTEEPLPLSLIEKEASKPANRPKSAFSASARSPSPVRSELTAGTSRLRRARSATVVSMRTPVQASTAKRETITIRMPSTFEDARKTFGWRFEVHNDPLGVKRPYVAKRLSYGVPLNEPSVLPPEPKVAFASSDTFFSSTVPRVQFNFTIAPDFSSESYNRRKEELQKKGMWNYRHKDFSFLY